MKKLNYCVYVLRSLKDGDFYIGYTTNLNQRLTSHIKGESKATLPRRPFALIFCEDYKNKHDATNREKYFKTTKGKRALRLMLKETLNDMKNLSV
ncbi:hypothetical protein A2690_00140 [Candidatus Roizmanbacteria bacterium RIFCSPHIGHO2_01_FULL_39_12b]|uniref:GIY-YIG domain-containing protein n=1 Tax=Candidatus Roizmanbacteria bacterium RIFCSPHIGHO2_01_FULL_39_12b TaxID=1802030 RepID=A0A1F7GES3_9BACT|nr:MAG: hypothetical protein A2690_00140 [Candidatus Roizmanbacteria bacterium RIFCSPHIGHO2_01_FULL_39_12b]